jgi:hypothetical protein
MKGVYRGYSGLTAHDYDELWKDATFVFDTNVLLNLYRYQSSTATSLLSVLRKLSQRIWMPYHVGLEFERNRYSVVVEQHNRFSEVRAIVDKTIQNVQSELEALQLKTRHSHINPDKLLQDLSVVKDDYFSYLEELEKQSLQPASEDSIRAELYDLFDGKVGAPPPTQADLDKIFTDGEKRYAQQFPPGFRDAQKDGRDDLFTYGSLTYKRKFGDLVVWKQMIEHAKNANLKNLIYVTDDAKSDWWLIVKGRTVGPRPELIEEISRDAGVNRFHIYTSEAFLQYANEHLDANVETAAIDDVREVLASRHFQKLVADSLKFVPEYRIGDFSDSSEVAESAVFEWLSERYDEVKRNVQYPDLLARRDGLLYGFDVKVLARSSNIRLRFELDVFKALRHAQMEEMHQIVVVYVMQDTDFIGPVINMLRSKVEEIRYSESLHSKARLKIMVGFLEDYGAEHGAGEFVLFDEFGFRD